LPERLVPARNDWEVPPALLVTLLVPPCFATVLFSALGTSSLESIFARIRLSLRLLYRTFSPLWVTSISGVCFESRRVVMSFGWFSFSSSIEKFPLGDERSSLILFLLPLRARGKDLLIVEFFPLLLPRRFFKRSRGRFSFLILRLSGRSR